MGNTNQSQTEETPLISSYCHADEMTTEELAQISYTCLDTEDRLTELCEIILSFCGPGYWSPGKVITKFETFPLIPEQYNPNEEFTILTWFNIQGGGYHYLVSRGEWTETYSIGVLATHDRQGRARAYFRTPLYSSKPVPRGENVCLALTYLNRSVKLYMDGELQTRATIPNKKTADDTELYLGGEGIGLGNKYRNHRPRGFMRGTLLVEIHQRCLNAEEIEAKTMHPQM